jgi:hypothetical protein
MHSENETMPNVIFFQITADDPEAAAGFYSRVFGWEIEEEENGSDYWSITTGDEDDPGIPGALTTRFDESNPTINTIEVPSLSEYAKKITEAGGKVLGPQIAIPGEGYVQYCHDFEGNAFAIFEYDDSAQ